VFAIWSDAASTLVVNTIFSLWILILYGVKKDYELHREVLRRRIQRNIDLVTVVPSISDLRFQTVSVIFGEINKRIEPKIPLLFSRILQDIGFIKTSVIQPVVQALKRVLGWILWFIGFIKRRIIQPIVQELKELDSVLWVAIEIRPPAKHHRTAIDFTFLLFCAGGSWCGTPTPDE
jgi:hypothetical protein